MGATAVVIKATGEDTSGAFFVAEIVLEAGFPGPPRHFHERLHCPATESAAPPA
jgi:hypothetical protein